jgi:hypothetical protein
MIEACIFPMQLPGSGIGEERLPRREIRDVVFYRLFRLFGVFGVFLWQKKTKAK